MTNIISGALLVDPARPGAFSPRPSCPGTGVPGIGSGTGPRAAARPVMRVRDKGTLAFSAPQLAQTNNYNHMTSVVAVGEGASGPTLRPLCRAPA